MKRSIDLLLRKKPIYIILAIKENGKSFASEISKKADVTYSHTVKILERLKKEGIIIKEKYGRVSFIKLTEKGRRLQESILKLLEDLK